MVCTLFKRNMRSSLKILIALFAVISMYTAVIVYMYNPELSEMLSGYQEVLPDMMAVVGMTGIATNILEWIQIYLYGFIMILFPMIFGIIVVNKLIMSYIDSGSMASLLSSPHSRTRIILTQAVTSVFLMFILMAAVTLLGFFCSHAMFPGELDTARYIELNASLLLMQFMNLGIGFTAACFCSESRHFYLLGAGIPILFFLFQMLSNMGGSMEKLKYFTLYFLFPAEKIVQAGGDVWPRNLIMASIALALFAAGILWFRRRDLSI